jgi:hypothetical protein
MTETSVTRKFEVAAIRPLWVLTLLATLLAAITRHWWSLALGIVALFVIGMIGASLHPTQSAGDLLRGPLEGPAAVVEQGLLSDDFQRLLVSRACTQLAMLLAAILAWIGIALLDWHWYVVLPVAYIIAALIGAVLKQRFVLAGGGPVESHGASA